MKTTEIQILRASIVERILHIENMDLLRKVEKQIMPPSPLAYTRDEVREMVRECIEADKSTFIDNKDVVEMAKLW